MSRRHTFFAQRALDIAIRSAQKGTGPFGAVVVRNGKIIAEGHNEVTKKNDPTAHAEIEAIRSACSKLDDYQLTDCILYTSSFPCPQCLGAIYWARPKAVYYTNTLAQAANMGFDDRYIYNEFKKVNSKRKYSLQKIALKDESQAFKVWNKKKNKKIY